MRLPPDTRLGRYEIRSLIGAGGMGEVYLARDMRLDRQVALKILPPEVAANQDRMRRFVQEARAASTLNHPNILTIYEIDQAEAGHFIATEFIDGETLRERLKRDPIPLNDALDITIQIASALAAAHDAGITHRDIKPENVMLRRDGYVKVLDFGLAKLTERSSSEKADEALTGAAFLTEPGTVMGTAFYMSPEQARGLLVDPRTDIFSLGVVLYEMVTGRPPFGGATTNDVLASILSDKEPARLARYLDDVPPELERIVAKALRKSRDARYQTIKDLLLDIKSLKQELEFKRTRGEVPYQDSNTVARISRVSLSQPSAASSIDRSGPQPSLQRSVSSAEYIAERIKQHKPAVTLMLSVVISGIIAISWFFLNRFAGTATLDSIAVMPFENMTHDKETDYLSDGVTDALINSLSQLPHTKVIARNSVFSYKNQNPDLQQVARQLDVQTVLTGRVLLQGNTLDVRVELTDARHNSQLWGDHYTLKVSDIFSIQDQIARQVTETLRVRLSGGQQERVTKRYTENVEAYRRYLQGRYYFNEGSEEGLNRAVSFFDQAVALDSQYALAYAARAETYFNMGDLSLPMAVAKRKVIQDVNVALNIDENLSEARATRANVEFQYDWDFARAEADFKQVIASNPNDAWAHDQYTYLLAMTGRPLEALAEIRLAQQLDPVNPSIAVDVSLPYYLERQYDQSIAEARKAADMFPNFFLPHMAMGSSLFESGDRRTGIEELEKAKAMESTPLVIGNLGYGYAKAGRQEEARKLIAELQEQSKSRYVPSYWIGMIYAGLGDKDEAFSWLEKAYQDRSWWLVWIKMSPMVDSLRSDARFIDLMRRMNFPQ